jgi:broad specificity phosphatase PhoE
MPAAEAATNHREDFATWRERPAEFNFDGRYPLLEVFDRAAEAWKGNCQQATNAIKLA